MNSHELALELLKLPDAPVVMSQEDEPLGDYEVCGAEAATMYRDSFWRTGRLVWSSSANRDDDGPQTAIYLSADQPPAIVVDAPDAEVVVETKQVPCPSCGNPLTVSAVTLPGDTAICGRCQQYVTLPPTPVKALTSFTDMGPTWRQLLAGHATAIEDHDRDTRVLATADQGHADCHEQLSMPAAYARLDYALAVGCCYVCDKPTEELVCDECTTVIAGSKAAR